MLFQTNSYKVLVFEICLFENQSMDGPPSGSYVRKGLRKSIKKASLYKTVRNSCINDVHLRDSTLLLC